MFGTHPYNDHSADDLGKQGTNPNSLS
jgi:hypothetical protein